MRFTIEWSEVIKEGTGEKGAWKMSKMTLKDEEGNTIENVRTFEPAMPGQELEGLIVYNEKYKTNEFKKKLEKPNFLKHKDAQIEKAVARKETSIARFADNKDFSIMQSSTMRDAVLLAIAQQDPSHENVLAQRKWLLDHWEVKVTDTEPF